MPSTTHRYELIECDVCGRERIRQAQAKIILRCDCGSRSFRIFDLVAYLRDPYAVADAPPSRRLVLAR